MSERYWNADRTIVIALWVLVIGMAKSTVVGHLFLGLDHEWIPLALVVMMPVTGLTMVLHYRLYAIRLASVIRGTATANQESVRHLRP